MKFTQSAKTGSNNRKFENSSIKLDGVEMAVIGKPRYHSSLCVIISKSEEFAKFDGREFQSRAECIAFIKAIK